MEILKSFILGLVQGLTEFIPVSSSGHLVLASHFLNVKEPEMTFEIFVHLGSMIAVVIYFRKEIMDLLRSLIFFRNKEYHNNRKICLWLFVATIVTGILGFLFKDLFESLFNMPLFVASMLGLTGFILFISDKIGTGSLKASQIQKPDSTPIPLSPPYPPHKCGGIFSPHKCGGIFSCLRRGVEGGQGIASSELNIKKSIFIGLGQALAITPGISRSGTTIFFSLLAGLDRKSAAAFSFLLSIPAIIGANLSEFKNFSSLDNEMLLNYLIGFVTAFVSGYLVIAWLIKLVTAAKLKYFSYYCWGVSILCILYL